MLVIDHRIYPYLLGRPPSKLVGGSAPPPSRIEIATLIWPPPFVPSMRKGHSKQTPIRDTII